MSNIQTRFRAYQLGGKGSSFSYYADGHFTLIEGRLTEINRPTLLREMAICNVVAVDTLHVTSWDADHCAASEMEELLELARPEKIECPGYVPHTINGETCLEIIEAYKQKRQFSNKDVSIREITPSYIKGLIGAEELAYRDTFYNPIWIDEICPNNNSTAKHFRKGSFNVLSLGDVESSLIGARLRRQKILKRETDVMILAHHGADNGFTTKNLLRNLEPSIAICSSNYDNMYDHPTLTIRELLHRLGIRLMTTKTGDVIVKSIGDHSSQYRAINLMRNSSEVSSACNFISRKSRLLGMNRDALRQAYTAKPFYLRR